MVDSSGDTARRVARARERFLASGDAPQTPLRAGIMESWRRSLLFGIDCERLEAPYFGDLDTDGRLMYAARPVLDRLEEMLADAAMGVLLTDAHGRVLDRRVRDRSLVRQLDEILLAPGFSYAEEHVGTNGIGTAIETRGASCVFGNEHFIEPLQRMACAGAPVRDRLTGRLAGLLDITAWNADAGPLMMAVAQNAAQEIAQRMAEAGSEGERAMLEEFLAVRARGNQPIVSVGENLTMVNRPAADLLDQADYAIIQDKAAELSTPGRETVGQITLSRGEPASLRCRTVRTHAGTAGAVLEIIMVEDRPSYRVPDRPSELGLAGGSVAFRRVCAELQERCRARTWTIVEGEPGVGKLTVVAAVHRHCGPEGTFSVIEPEDVDEDPAACLDRTAAAARVPGSTVVLRHPERYTPAALAAIATWMDSWPESTAASADRPWVVATLPVGTELADELPHRLPVTLTVPALRHRIEDVRELVPALLRRSGAGRAVSCGPAAMRVLLRSAWPGNVAELADVLRQVLTRRRTGQIEPADLPASCHARSRRVLTPWETSERDAIVEALLKTGGDRAAAADLLGISRATIYRKINLYGVSVGPRPAGGRRAISR
ncbi:sigma-54-dependent Fis family transcriptional regulator [Actinoallomurus sp. CA-142502]|uniref:sigma-54-dependent Fis family transcriptional regulator n=1 Tax=Actinoallomurus sp. CA-142502 TaxID=3239885 RepID=UPI003D905009